jgi:hypothetical protein
MSGANDRQPGGSHYKPKEGSLQHWDVCELYGIGYCESAATKYTFRWKEKNGLEDLYKAEHYTEKLIELHLNHGRLPRGIVPRAVLHDWLRDNKVSQSEGMICALLFRWETEQDLRDALREIRVLIQRASV